MGLLLGTAVGTVRAQERGKQRRIAIVIPAGPIALISETGDPFWGAILLELRRLGDVEGENLTVDRYSAEGRTAGLADLTREVVNRNPDVIVAASAITQAARAANATIPIVWVGADPIRAGLVTSLARPGGNITGVSIDAGIEIWGKRLQILKEAVPAASKIGRRKRASRSQPTIGDLADPDAPSGGDTIRGSTRVRGNSARAAGRDHRKRVR